MQRGGFVVVLLLLFAGHAAAQEMVVRGIVVGPDSTPVALDRVLLHRVDQSGGATIAEAATGPNGRFNLTAPAATDTSAIYFVAANYQGELYIGPFFRPQRDVPDQVLQVGVPENSAAAMFADPRLNPAQPPPLGRPATPTSWLLLILPLLGVATVVLYLIASRRRMAPQRALLIRIAEIDERMNDAPPGQRDAMQTERVHLIEQLRAG